MDIEYKMGELFCGPGGIALGALSASVPGAKITHQWSSDYDPTTCMTYTNNICPDNPSSVICKDVRKLDITNLPEINGFAFGFPCNDFSVVGKREGFNGIYGPLYSYGVKVLMHFQPDWFLAENVGGIKSTHGGENFKIILNDLHTAGYDIFPHLYKFEEYGIPQTRHRVIIIGIRKDLHRSFRIPSTEEFKDTDISCQTALANIPEWASNNELPNMSYRVTQRLKYIKPGKNAFNSEIPSEFALNVAHARLSQIYRRLKPDEPSYTITGSGGGGTYVYHWEENRALTNREKARLQTFPDTFVFSGNKTQVKKQIGMAVPCTGAKIIFEALLKTMLGIDYPSTDQNILFNNY